MSNYRKKLIEVNIPLQAINVESAKDASLTHGHPSTLHRYWARQPLAACRAVVFASMVDDPSECKDEFPTEPEQNAERNRLHNLIKRLVVWQNSNDENLLAEARYEIAYAVARNNGENLPVFREQFKNDPKAVLQYLHDRCPAVYDPFCGGGSIPFEAQRLGLRARASDLNPLPVLLNKAMIELPPKFHDQNPVNPDADPLEMFTGIGRNRTRAPWKGTAGLAADIRYYGAWMREEAHRRIGHLYPQETGELDRESQFCLTWLQQHGYIEGNFGDAEGLSKAKDIDLTAMHDKLLLSARGKVRLLKAEEYAERDNSENMTAWEGCLRMVWHLSGVEKSGGISGCTAVARAMRDYESAKRLAGILYTYYERRGDAESAAHYNNLVTQWQDIWKLMGSPEQMEMETAL